NLEDIKASVEQRKHQMREIASEQVEIIQIKILIESDEETRIFLEKTKSHAEIEASNIMVKSEDATKDFTKKKIEERFDEAVNLVCKKVMGD
ncbi:MAG TPA: hypothetical protein VIH27_03960, partial [Nitrososphaerales archaeon]